MDRNWGPVYLAGGGHLSMKWTGNLFADALRAVFLAVLITGMSSV